MSSRTVRITKERLIELLKLDQLFSSKKMWESVTTDESWVFWSVGNEIKRATGWDVSRSVELGYMIAISEQKGFIEGRVIDIERKYINGKLQP